MHSSFSCRVCWQVACNQCILPSLQAWGWGLNRGWCSYPRRNWFRVYWQGWNSTSRGLSQLRNVQCTTNGNIWPEIPTAAIKLGYEVAKLLKGLSSRLSQFTMDSWQTWICEKSTLQR
jgi:hypothetical protein